MQGSACKECRVQCSELADNNRVPIDSIHLRMRFPLLCSALGLGDYALTQLSPSQRQLSPSTQCSYRAQLFSLIFLMALAAVTERGRRFPCTQRFYNTAIYPRIIAEVRDLSDTSPRILLTFSRSVSMI